MARLPAPPEAPAIIRGRTLEARLDAVLIADGESFVSRMVEEAELTAEGMAGDLHAGFLRKAGAREPWYRRGTMIRSGRQLTILSQEDLAAAAAALGLDTVDAGAIGANLVISGVPAFSYLPAGTRLFLAGGASVVVEGQNAPCRYAGKALAALHPGRGDIEFGFVKAAAGRRGVVASVERPGVIRPGGAVAVKLPDQWIWQG